MTLSKEIKEQLASYLQLLESDVVIETSLNQEEDSNKVRNFLSEIVEMSDQLSITEVSGERVPSFGLARKGEKARVFFAGLPLGHEFTSFILALLQVSGRSPKIDSSLIQQIQDIQEPHQFTTYVSLSCHNCPDVVQSLNMMAILNPLITHTMVEGGMFQTEISKKGIMSVPAVEDFGDSFHSGRAGVEELLKKLTPKGQVKNSSKTDLFDVLVIGGGPAGNTAAIYAARKGLQTGLVADKFGGQVVETVGIENMIGTPYIEGPQLMQQVESHTRSYPVEMLKGSRVVSLEKKEHLEIQLEDGSILKTKTAILALGAKWRNINIPGEERLKNKGVTYCPHCDGPLFKDKKVAVIGGGNSGLEAAVDLAGLASQVYVLEFLPDLKADQVLQDKAKELKNIQILRNVATQEIIGENHVEGLIYQDRQTQEQKELMIDGVFVQIGLIANTDWLEQTNINRNDKGEIIVDNRGETSLPGVFAAGDCTDSAYKQIIISMGSGATAALGAFDYLIRH